MLSRPQTPNISMAASNKNNIHDKREYQNIPAGFRQTFSTSRNLPSISNILIRERRYDDSSHADNNSSEGLYTITTEKRSSTPKATSPRSNSPSSPLPHNSINPSSTHKRAASLESLMDAAEQVRTNAPNLGDKVSELQKIRDLILEHINFLEGKYNSLRVNENGSHKESDTYDTLRKLQNLSIYLHDLVIEMLSSQRMKLINMATPTILPKNFPEDKSITNMSKQGTSISLPQPRLTLLPPLQIKEDSKTTQRLTSFKFPDLDKANRGQNIVPSAPLSSSELIERDQSLQKTNDTVLGQKIPFKSRNITTLQTPKDNHSSIFSPIEKDDGTPQSSVVVTGKLNKMGKSFTLFPKSDDQNDGKSTIITPVTQEHKRLGHTRDESDHMLVIPPLTNYQESVTITPNSSREENRILSEIEEGPSLPSPTNVKRFKTSPASKILTSKSGAPVGMTTTLKLTNNSLLEKPLKKTKIKERQEQGTITEPHLEPISTTGSTQTKEGLQENEENENQSVFEENPNKKCFHCQSSKTPEWRAGPYGGENICNACGLFYRKIISKFGEKGGNLLMRYRQIVCPKNRRVPAYIEIPEEYMIRFSREAGFDQFNAE